MRSSCETRDDGAERLRTYQAQQQRQGPHGELHAVNVQGEASSSATSRTRSLNVGLTGAAFWPHVTHLRTVQRRAAVQAIGFVPGCWSPRDSNGISRPGYGSAEFPPIGVAGRPGVTLVSMKLVVARLCLDCDEVHDEERCPTCASEVFAFSDSLGAALERAAGPIDAAI